MCFVLFGQWTGSLSQKKSGSSRARSLDGDELGASGGTDTDLTVTNGLVSHGVLAKVVADHVSPDLHRVPVFARVDFGDGTDHLGHDDTVPQVRFHRRRLLSIGGVLDGLRQLLDETVVTRVDPASESPALARSEHGDDIGGVHLEELVELDTSVNLLFEWFSFGSLRGLRSCKFFLDRGHI